MSTLATARTTDTTKESAVTPGIYCLSRGTTAALIPVAAVRRFLQHKLGHPGDELVEVDMARTVSVDFIEDAVDLLRENM